MSAFPFPPILGRNLTALTIQALAYTESTGGLATTGSAIDLKVKLDNFSEDLSAQHDNIKGFGTGKSNNVPIEDDSTFNITVHLDQTSTDYNKLKALFFSNSYFRISYTIGTGSNGKVEVSDWSRGTLSSPFGGEGAQRCTATFLQIDSGASFKTRTNVS